MGAVATTCGWSLLGIVRPRSDYSPESHRKQDLLSSIEVCSDRGLKSFTSLRYGKSIVPLYVCVKRKVGNSLLNSFNLVFDTQNEEMVE